MDKKPNDRLKNYRFSEPPSSDEDMPTPEIYIIVNQDSLVKLSMESCYDVQSRGEAECHCNAVSLCTCNKVCTCNPVCRCMEHSTCHCDSHTETRTTPICTCDLVCTCVPVT